MSRRTGDRPAIRVEQRREAERERSTPKVASVATAREDRRTTRPNATTPIPATRYARLLQSGSYVEQYAQQTNVYAGAFHVAGSGFGQKNRQYVVSAIIATVGRPTSHVAGPYCHRPANRS
ncbi:hypothetical protein ACFQL4_02820 [Halosimplex aquaticum]